MTDTIDFTELSLKQTLDLAAAIEDEAKERYEEFAEQMEAHHTAETAEFFRTMAQYENLHGDRLRERRRQLFGDEPVDVDESMVVDVEAPEYSEARAFMSIGQALTTAFRSEVKAWEFYDGAMQHVDDADLRGMLEELRDQEAWHQKLIKEWIDRHGDEPDLDPDDFVDPPIAQ